MRDGPAEVAALFERARAEGIARDELRVERKDGRLIHARVTATTIEGADGTHEGYVIAATDVTDERLQRQRLQVLNRVMRHNLRNDLTVIRGHAARLAEEAPEDLARSAELVRETADGLLDVARKARRVEDSVDQIGTGRVETAGELVPSLIDRLSARYPGATIISDCEGCAEVPVSEHLGVAVEELVENAVEHAGRPDPTVEVSGDEVDGFLRLVVTDDGPGIPPHERLTVERGEETPITHGSGIGLWMVAWVVQQLGGQFSVDALADGAGTKATLSVPPRYVEGEDVDRVSAAPGFSMADHRDGDASERPADGDDPETADDEE